MRKSLTGFIFAVLASAASGATTVPVQLLNPAGSTTGKTIVSTGPTTAPAWANVSAASLASQAANTVVANVTGSAASPTAFAMPTCSTSTSALQWTSGTGFTCFAGSAPLASPTFTGTPAAPTAAVDTNTTQLATTAYVVGQGYLKSATAASTYAPLASPTFTGAPLAPTATAGTSTTQLATTAFVTGKFTAFARVFATKTTALSLTNNAATTISGWTTTFDVNSNFVASTGVFTAPSTGYYLVSTQVVTATTAIAAGSLATVSIVGNGSSVAQGETAYPTASGTNSPLAVHATALVSLSAGQTVIVQVFQNSGAAVNTTTATAATYISIEQLP